MPQQPLPLVQQQQQFVQQQVQTAPSTSKTTIIKSELPNTPLAVQQIQVLLIEEKPYHKIRDAVFV